MRETFDSILTCIITRFQDLIQWSEQADISLSLEIEGWRRAHLVKMIQTLDSIICLIKKQDYISSCVLLRALYDSWFSLLFIYESTPQNERDLRFLLYVLDGIEQRDSALAVLHQDDGGAINSQEESIINTIISRIQGLTIYSESKATIDDLVKSHNWKYISLSQPKSTFTWSDIYQMISDKSTKSFINFLSQYVHGLYCSIFVISISKNEFVPLAKEVLNIEISILQYIETIGVD